MVYKDKSIAVVSVYGPSDQDLLRLSYGTYNTRKHFRDIHVIAIDAICILSVVLMAPDPVYHKWKSTSEVWWFLMERPGLRLNELFGLVEENDADDGNEGSVGTI